MSRAYYNEFDKGAAAWLRELIKAGHIADGDVDERSIEDVLPSDLIGYTQCHFFAGIGGWSYALRLAGWPDDRPVWTGSCPCQPFSAAGQGAAFADERHLWPAFHHLIKERRPVVVFGEQVDAAVRSGWWDLVADDMEGLGYSAAGVVFPSSAVGAPHIRHRLYFVLQCGETTTTESEPLNETLHKMSGVQAHDIILQRTPVERWIADGLQDMLGQSTTKSTRAVEPGGDGKANGRAQAETRGSGASLLCSTAHELPRERTDTSCTSSGNEKGVTLRPGRACRGAGPSGGQESLRDDWLGTTTDPSESVQQPIVGQDSAGEGLCVQQCEGGLLRPELCAGNLGGGFAPADCGRIESEEGLNVTEHTVQTHGENTDDERWEEGSCDKGIGAPHIRDRLYWVAGRGVTLGDACGARLEGYGRGRQAESGRNGAVRPVTEAGELGGMADHNGNGRHQTGQCFAEAGNDGLVGNGSACLVADANGRNPSTEREQRGWQQRQQPEDGGILLSGRPGPTNGFWRDADWLFCRDGKFRPVEPGTFPLVDGLPRGMVPSSRIGMAVDANKTAEARVMRLRGYGNAINPVQAAMFVEAFMELAK